MLQQSVREFAEREVRPNAKEIDETGRFPRETFAKAADLAEVKKMLAAVNTADLKPGNAGPIDKMADEINQISVGLAQSQDGSNLAAVDSLIPGPDKYKGAPYSP